MYDLNANWNDDPDLSNISFYDPIEIKHDSIITLIWNKIIDEHISVKIKNDDADIIYLSFISLNEEFSNTFQKI